MKKIEINSHLIPSLHFLCQRCTLIVVFDGQHGNANYFNADLSKWNTGKVRTMKYMFREAQYFNTDVSKWDVSQVENMESSK